MNRFGKVPSSEIIRQAKQEIYGLVDTKRPETPRHPNLSQEKWDYYGGNGGSGDKHTLDKCKFHFRIIGSSFLNKSFFFAFLYCDKRS